MFKTGGIAMIKMATARFFQGLVVFSFLDSTDQTGTTGNPLVSCAACQTAQVQLDFWDCDVSCDVISSENDITVTSTQIRELMRKLDELNNTMAIKVGELNNTVMELEDKNRRLEEANCTFSVRLAADVDINQNPVKFETVDLNICDAYDPATGIFTPTLNGTYFMSVHAGAGINNGHLRIMRNDDILCQSWLTSSGHGDVGTCSVTVVLSVGDSVRVTGSAEAPGRIAGARTGFTGVMIRP